MFSLLLLWSVQSTGLGGEWSQVALVPGQSQEQFGTSLDVGPDYDGDGWPEYVVGARDRRSPPSGRGGISLIHGRTGTRIWEFVSPYPHGITFAVGASVGFVPDLNGDGFADVLTGDPLDDFVAYQAGRVYVLDGVRGAILREHLGADTWWYGDNTGTRVLGVHDVNGDGAGDYAISSPLSDLGGGLGNEFFGKVVMYSGSTGLPIWTFSNPRLRGVGEYLELGPDLDGDGVTELLVGGYGYLDPESVHYVSGRTGQVIRTLVVPTHLAGVVSVEAVDLDGDDVEDLVTGSAHAGNTRGIVAAFSSTSLQMLWQYDAQVPFEYCGLAVCPLDDLDLDGTPEVSVGVPTDWLNHASGKGYVLVLSGESGLPLWRIRTTSQVSGFYAGVLGAIGLNGRRDTLLAGEPYREVAYAGDGAVHVIRLDPFVRAGSHTLSASNGGSVAWDLQFPVSDAGSPYALLCSAAGRGPTTIGGLQVPLSADGVLARTMAGQHPAGFQGGRGMLDATGRATVSWQAAAGSLGAYVGRTLQFAAVTGSGGQGTHASIAVPLRIIP